MAAARFDVQSVEDLRFRCLNNALYHTARRGVLEGFSRLFNFLVIVGGTATIAQLSTNFGIEQAWIGFAITLVGSLQLVFDYAGRARAHELLQRRYYDLMARIEDRVDPDAKFRASIMSDIAKISGEEPPNYRIVDAIAFNNANEALYGDERAAHKLRISFMQYLTQHIWQHHSAILKPVPG